MTLPVLAAACALSAGASAADRISTAGGRLALVVEPENPGFISSLEVGAASMPLDATSWYRDDEAWHRLEPVSAVAAGSSAALARDGVRGAWRVTAEADRFRIELSMDPGGARVRAGRLLLFRFPEGARFFVPYRREETGVVRTLPIERRTGLERLGNRPLPKAAVGWLAALGPDGAGFLLLSERGDERPLDFGNDERGDFVTVPLDLEHPSRTVRLVPFDGGIPELTARVTELAPPMPLRGRATFVAAGAGLEVFSAPIGERLAGEETARTAPPVGEVRLRANPAERVAVQLGIRGGVAGANLALEEGSGARVDGARLFEARPRKIEIASTMHGTAGDVPDDLVRTSRIRLAAERSTVVVVEFAVPATAVQGELRSVLRIDVGPASLRIPIVLEVAGEPLPDPPSFPAIAPAWPRVVLDATAPKLSVDVLSSILDEMRGARLSQGSPAKSAIAEFDCDGRLAAIDFGPFDRALPALERTTPGPALLLRDFRIGVSHELVATPFGPPEEAGTPIWWHRVESFAEAFAAHLRELGLLERVVLQLFDEPWSSDLPLLVELSARLRSIAPDWRPVVFGDPGARFRSAFDLVVLPEEHSAEVGDFWLLNPRGFELDADPFLVSSLGWRLFAERASGMLQWTSTAWVEETGNEDRWDANREASWFSFDAAGLHPTLRLLRFRESLADLERLRRLEKMAGGDPAAAAFLDRVRKLFPRGAAHDPGVDLEPLRAELRRLLERSGDGRAGSRAR